MLQSRSSVLIRWKYDIVGGVDKKKIIRIANCDENGIWRKRREISEGGIHRKVEKNERREKDVKGKQGGRAKGSCKKGWKRRKRGGKNVEGEKNGTLLLCESIYENERVRIKLRRTVRYKITE